MDANNLLHDACLDKHRLNINDANKKMHKNNTCKSYFVLMIIKDQLSLVEAIPLQNQSASNSHHAIPQKSYHNLDHFEKQK
jgi:hypothetical protein